MAHILVVMAGVQGSSKPCAYPTDLILMFFFYSKAGILMLDNILLGNSTKY